MSEHKTITIEKAVLLPQSDYYFFYDNKPAKVHYVGDVYEVSFRYKNGYAIEAVTADTVLEYNLTEQGELRKQRDIAAEALYEIMNLKGFNSEDLYWHYLDIATRAYQTISALRIEHE